MPFATIVIVAATAAAIAAPAIIAPAEFERQHGTLSGAAVIAAPRARGAARVVVVDGLGHVPVAVLALVARAGRRHDELAGTRMSQRSSTSTGTHADRWHTNWLHVRGGSTTLSSPLSPPAPSRLLSAFER